MRCPLDTGIRIHGISDRSAPLPRAVRAHAAAVAFGARCAWPMPQGAPIGANARQSAAHAQAPGVTRVGNSTRDFSRVPGLRLENRAKPV